MWTPLVNYRATWLAPVDENGFYWARDSSVPPTTLNGSATMLWESYAFSDDMTTYQTRPVMSWTRVANTSEATFNYHMFSTQFAARFGGLKDNPTGPMSLYFVDRHAMQVNGPANCSAQAGYTPVIRVDYGSPTIYWSCMPAVRSANGGFAPSLYAAPANTYGHATGGEANQYTGNLYIQSSVGGRIDDQDETSSAASTEGDWVFGVWDPKTGNYSLSGSVQPGDWFQGMATVPQERRDVRANVDGGGYDIPYAPCDFAMDADGNLYTYAGRSTQNGNSNMSLVRVEPARDSAGNIVDGTAANPWRYYVVEKIRKAPGHENEWWSSSYYIWGSAFLNGKFFLAANIAVHVDNSTNPPGLPASAKQDSLDNGTTAVVMVDPMAGTAQISYSRQNEGLDPCGDYISTGNMYTDSASCVRDNASTQEAMVMRGWIYNDRNGNGVHDANEPGVAGQTVGIYSATTNQLLSQQVTNTNGSFSFILGNGAATYYVRPVQVRLPVTTPNGTTYQENAIQTWGSGSTETVNDRTNTATMKCTNGDNSTDVDAICDGARSTVGANDPAVTVTDRSQWMNYATVQVNTSDAVPTVEFGYTVAGSYGDAAAGPANNTAPVHVNSPNAQLYLGNQVGRYAGPVVNDSHTSTDDGVFLKAGGGETLPMTNQILSRGYGYPMSATVNGPQAGQANTEAWATSGGAWNNTPVWTASGASPSGTFTPATAGATQVRVSTSTVAQTQPTNATGEYASVNGNGANWMTPGEIEDYAVTVTNDAVYRPAARTVSGSGTFTVAGDSITAGTTRVVSPTPHTATPGSPVTLSATAPSGWSLQSVTIKDFASDNVLATPAVSNGSFTYTPTASSDVIIEALYTPAVNGPNSSLAVNPAVQDVNRNIQVTGTARSADNTLLPGVTVNFSKNSPDVTFVGGIDSCVTDANGTCSVSVTSTKPLVDQVSATMTNGNPPVTPAGSPARIEFKIPDDPWICTDPGTSTFTVSPVVSATDSTKANWRSASDRGTAADQYYTGTATLMDCNRNPLTNVSADRIRFESTSSNVDISSVTNNNDGTYTVHYTSKVASADPQALLRVRQPDSSMAQIGSQLPIPFKAGPPVPNDPNQPTCSDGKPRTGLTAAPTTVDISARAVLTLTVTDQFCNVVENLPVTFNKDKSHAMISNATSPTDSTGKATADLRDSDPPSVPDTVVANATFTYNGQPMNGGSVPVTFTETPVICPDLSTMSVSPQATTGNSATWVPADDRSAYTGTITLRACRTGTPMDAPSPSDVTVTASDPNVKISSVTKVPNQPGVYTVQMTSPVNTPETTTAQAKFQGADVDAPKPIPFRSIVCIEENNPNTSTFTVTPVATSDDSTWVLANGTDSYTGIFTAKKCETGEPASGLNLANIRFTPSSGDVRVSNVVESATQPGVYTVQFTSTVPHDDTTATLAYQEVGKTTPTQVGTAKPIPFKADAVVICPDHGHSPVTVNPANQIAGSPVTVTVTVRECNNKPVEGLTASDFVMSGPGTNVPDLTFTNFTPGPNGVYTFDTTSPFTGQFPISATVKDTPLDDHPTATFGPGNVCVSNCTPVDNPLTPDVNEAQTNRTKIRMAVNDQVANGTAKDTAVAEAYDTYGNPVPNAVFTVTDSTTGSLANNLTPRTQNVTTGSNGKTSTDAIAWTSNTVGHYQAATTVRSGTMTNNVEVTDNQGLDDIRFINDNLSATRSTLELMTSSPQQVGGSYTLKATIRDRNGTLVPNQTVTFTIDQDNPKVSFAGARTATCTTDSQGVCTVTTVTSVFAGEYKVHGLIPVGGSLTDILGSDYPSAGSNNPAYASPKTVLFIAGPVCTENCTPADDPTTPGEDESQTHRTKVVVDPNGSLANGQAADTINVYAYDQYGNPVSQAPVSASINPAVTLTTPTPTNANGVSQINATSTTEGTYPVTVTVGGKTPAPADVIFSNVPVDSVVLAIDSTSPKQVGETFAITPTVTDNLGRPLSGIAVTYTLPADLTAADGTSTTCTTGSNGRCAPIQVTSTKVGTYPVTATAGGKTSAPVNPEFTAGPVSGANSTVEVTRNGVLADGVQQDIAQVTARDRYNNLVQGATVTSTPVAGQSSGLTVQPSIAATGTNGQTTIWYTSTEATPEGTPAKQADVRINGSQTPVGSPVQLRFVTEPGDPGHSSWTIAPDGPLTVGPTTNAASRYTLTATVRDQNNLLVQGALVTFKADKADTAWGSTPQTCTTNAQGVCSVTVTSTKAGTYAFTAELANGQIETAKNAIWTPDAVNGSHSSVEVVDNNRVADGNSRDTVLVTARDQYDNPVPGQSVRSTPVAGAPLTVQPNIAFTDANGQTTIWYTSTKADTHQAGVTIGSGNAVPQGSPVSLTFIPGLPDPGHSTITANPPSQTVGQPITVTATVKDANDNPVPGVPVVVDSNGDSYPVGPSQCVTGTDGTCQVQISDRTPEPVQIDADMMVNGQPVALTPVNVVFTPGTISHTCAPGVQVCTNLSVDPADVVIPGTSTATVVATDYDGNRLANQQITFTVDKNAAIGATGTAKTATVTTDSNGEAKVVIRDARPEAVLVSATDSIGAVPGSPATVNFRNGAVCPDSPVTVNPSTQIAGSPVTVTVTVRDCSGNPIGGLTANDFVMTGPGTNVPDLTFTNFTPGANGVYTFDTTSPLVGQFPIGATVQDVPLNDHPTVTFVPGNVCVSNCTPVDNPLTPENEAQTHRTKIRMTVNDSLANGTARNTATGEAYDTYGNVVPNAVFTVTDSTTGSLANILTPRTQTATTDSTGKATVGWTSTTVGHYQAATTVRSGSMTNSVEVTDNQGLDDIRFVPGNLSASRSTLELMTTSPQQVGGSYTLKATIRDVNGTLVPNQTVSFTIDQDNPKVSFGGARTATCTTDNQGVCQVTTVTSVFAGEYQVHGMIPVNGTLTDISGRDYPTANSNNPAYSSPKTVAFVAGPVCTENCTPADDPTTPGENESQTHVTKVVVDPNGAEANGVAKDTIRVSAYDQYGNPVRNSPVTVNTDSRVTLTPASASTDSNGVATIDATSTSVGDFPANVTVGGKTPPQSPVTLSFGTGAVSQVQLAIDSTQPKQVGETFAITPTVTDATGHGLPGVTVTYALPADLRAADGTSTTCTTGANGTCGPIQVTSTKAGTYPVTATAGGRTSNQVNPQFNAGPVSGANSTVEVTRNGVLADGVQQDIALVTAKDRYNNPVTGAVVTSTPVSGQSSGLTIQPNISPTGSDGTTTIWYTSNERGSKQADVRINSSQTPVGSPVTLAFVTEPGDPGHSSWTIAPAGPLTVGPTTGAASRYTLTATVRDQNNLLVEGALVTFKADKADTAWGSTPQTCTTNAQGVCSVTVTSTKAGTYAFTAELATGQIETAKNAIWTPDAVDGSHSTVEVVDNNRVADGNSRDTVLVTARDQYDNVVPGQSVRSVPVAGAPLTVQPNIAFTDANGQTTIWYTSTKADTHQAGVTIGSGNAVPQGSPVSLTFVPGLPDKGHSTITANPPSQTAGQPITVTATVKDANDNPVPGVTVKVDSDGDSYPVGPSQCVTGADGTCQVQVSDKTAEPVQIDADMVVNDQDVALDPANVVFTGDVPTTQPCEPGARQCTNLTVDPVDVTIPEASTATALITDKYGNPLSGVEVTFTVSNNGALGSGPAKAPLKVTTNSEGKAVATVRDEYPETVTVTATIPAGTVPTPQDVNFSLGTPDPGLSHVTVSPSTQIAGSPVTVTATIRDAQNRPINNLPLDAFELSGTGTDLPDLVFTNFTPGPDGTYTFQTTSQLAGDFEIAATVKDVPLNDKPHVAFTPGNVCVSNCQPVDKPSTPDIDESKTNVTKIVMTTNDQVANGQARDVATGEAYDTYGNPVTGAVFTVTDRTTNAALANKLNPREQNSPATGSDGKTTVSWTTTTAGVYSATATVKSGTMTNSIEVTESQTLSSIRFEPGDASAQMSTLEIDPAGPVTAGGSYTLKATIKDAQGNPLSGRTVNFSADSQKVEFGNGTTCETNSQGQCTVTASSDFTGTYPVHAKIPQAGVLTDLGGAGDPAKASPKNITFVPGAVCTQNCTPVDDPDTPGIDESLTNHTKVVVDPNDALANGTDKDTINVYAYDSLGNPVPNATVVATTSDSALRLSAPSAQTGPDGIAKIDGTSMVAGTHNAAVTVDGKVPQEPIAPMRFVNTATDRVTLTMQPTTSQEVGNVFAITPKVTDTSGNGVPGTQVTFNLPVNLSAAPGFSTTCTTGSNGECTPIQVTSTKVGSYPVTATAGSKTSDPVTAVFTPGPVDAAHSTAVVTKDGAGFDGVQQNIVTVTARDRFDNPVPGAVVASTPVAGQSSGLTVQPNIAPTGSDGTTTVWYTSNERGAKQADVRVGNQTPQGSPVTMNFANDQGEPANSSWTIAPLTSLTVGEPNNTASQFTLTATIKDRNNLPVDGALVTFKADKPDTAWGEAPKTCLTNAQGVCSATVTSTKAGTYAFTAEITKGQIGEAKNAIWTPDVVDGARSTVEMITNNRVADGDSHNVARVTARDKYDNPVPGQIVSSVPSADDPGGLVVQTGIPYTNSRGETTVWYATTKAGTHKADVTIGTAAVVPQGSPVSMSFGAGLPDPDHSSITADPTSQTVGDPITVTATIRDKFDNPVPDVHVFVDSDGNSYPIGTGGNECVTGANGTCTVQITDKTAEPVTINADMVVNDAPVALDPVGVEFTADVPEVTRCTDDNNDRPCTNFTVDPDTVYIPGTSLGTAYVTDQYRNPVAGVEVAFSVDRSATLTLGGNARAITTFADQTIGTTNAQGYAYVTIADQVPETVQVSARINGVHIAQTSPLPVTFLDDTRPQPPVITSPADNTLTNDPTPTISGTGEPGATVTVKDGDATVCTAQVDADGNWTCTPTTPLTDGPHTLTADQTDPSGNKSDPSAPVDILVDTTPPAVSVDRADRNQISGTAEPGTKVTVTVPGHPDPITDIPVDANGNWSIPTPSDAVTGTVTAVAVDEAGNVSDPATKHLPLDPPGAPDILVANGNEISGTADPDQSDPGDTVIVSTNPSDGSQPVVICTTTVQQDMTWRCETPDSAKNGSKDGPIKAVVVDPNGNQSPEGTGKLDTQVAPPVITSPANGSQIPSNRPPITGTSQEPGSIVTVTAVDNGGNTQTCTATVTDARTWSCTMANPFPDGPVTITARQTDPAGNVSGPSTVTTVTVDTKKPNAPTIDKANGGEITGTVPSTPDNPLVPGTTVTVTDENGNPVCTPQVVTVNADGSWTCIPLADVAKDGPINIVAKAKDPAGNESDPTTGRLDTTVRPPVIDVANGKEIGGTTDPDTKEVVVTYPKQGGGTGTIVVPINPGTDCTATACTWKVPTPSDATDGEVTAKATDNAGNTSDPSTKQLDVTPPTQPIVDPSNGKQITGKTDPNTKVIITGPDGNVIPGCENTRSDANGNFTCVPTTPVSPGTKVTVVAEDEAGNQSPPTTITVQPVTIEISKPDIIPGETQVVTGRYFLRGELVCLNVTPAIVAQQCKQAGDDGSVTFSFQVPNGTPRGSYQATVIGPRSGSADATFTVGVRIPTGGLVSDDQQVSALYAMTAMVLVGAGGALIARRTRQVRAR